MTPPTIREMEAALDANLPERCVVGALLYDRCKECDHDGDCEVQLGRGALVALAAHRKATLRARPVVERWLAAPPWDRPQHVDWWIGLYQHAGGDCGAGAEMAAYAAYCAGDDPGGPVVEALCRALACLAVETMELGR